MRWIKGSLAIVCVAVMVWAGGVLLSDRLRNTRGWRSVAETAHDTEDALLALECDRLSLNTATLEELEALPRIGPALAARIVEYREQMSGYVDSWELVRIRGIGEATYEALVEWVCACTPAP